jgi:hypothetical protein
MQALQARATFVEPGTIDDSFTAVISRQELEAAGAGDTAELWFEFGTDDSDESSRLSIDLAYSDIEDLLRLAPEDEIMLEVDCAFVEGIFGDDDVEAHGMKGAIAIAVSSAAILAPAGQAALSPQTLNPAANTVQRANVAATTQVSNPAARVQALNPQAKVQISKTMVLKANGFRLLRTTLAR